MTKSVLTIALIPGDINEFAAEKGSDFTLVPTDGYTKVDCHDCKKSCFIGPRQLEMYQTYDGPSALLCYRCLIVQPEKYAMIDLGNPDAAKVSWLP